MTTITAIILGAVEGLTEFLPISSTAHLTLASQILGLAQSEFVKTFEIAIQAGAILAILIMFWRKFLDLEILKRIIAAFIPTAIVGYVLYHFIKSYLIGNLAITLTALGLGGIFLIVFEKFFAKQNTEPVTDELRTLSWGKSVLIGLIQSLAVIPGVSRSAATIIGGLSLGVSRVAIVEFSFLLAVPTILAAAGYDLLKSASAIQSVDVTALVVGFIVSGVTAFIAVKCFLTYVKKHSFTAFGIYRILVAILFALIYLR